MLLLFKILILVSLLLIFFQDIRSRSVYWVLFPLLTGLLILIRIRHQGFFQFWQPALINLGFVIVQLFILTIYFSIKNKKWINVTSQLLGWGDILFLLSIAVYLSVLNFLFFYITSLVGILALWLTWQVVSAKKNKYIPLAGLQSLIFIVFLASDWWYRSFDLTDDTWLLNLITK